MAIDLIKNTLKYTIFLGLIGMFIAWAFHLNSSFVEIKSINGISILTFNWYSYISSLNDAWSTNALNFEDILPPGEFVEVEGAIWDETFWNTLFNNMAYIIQWIYFPLNFSAYIFRWFCWVIRLGLALIGWDFTIKANGDYNSILIQTLTWITQNLAIPYILQ